MTFSVHHHQRELVHFLWLGVFSHLHFHFHFTNHYRVIGLFHVWPTLGGGYQRRVSTRVLAFCTRLCPSSILASFEQYVHEWHLPLIFAFYCECYSWMLLIQMVQKPCLIRTEDHWDDIIDEPMPDFWWCVKFFKSFLVQLVDENVCYNWDTGDPIATQSWCL